MQLKKLVLKGFKSFAEKTVVEFDSGVTAVVGPNGSGKSNIIEAIRWVMGEQSAKNLRGGRMHDVIFSGTNARKPINIAEVTLVLDNKDGFLPVDFEEVSVTRRITRSGDSDYLMNKQPCRLKDIVDLFMDSGLGKESFSIISQGQVEAIFNSKAEDRRAIFEEAAGVFKYKVRKEKAERKLEDTQDNLDRVQDILYELDGQVEPLRNQASIAKEYLEKKEELTDLDIGVSVMRVQELQETVSTGKETLNELSEDLAEVESSISEDQTSLAELKGQLHEVERQREELNSQLLSTVQESERTEAALNLHAEKAKHKEAFLQEKQSSIEKQESAKADLLSRLEECEKTVQDYSEKVESLTQQLADKRAQMTRLEGNREEAMEELRATYIELMQKQTTLKNEQTYLEQQLSRQSIRREKVQKDATEAKKEFDEIDATVEAKIKEHESVKESLDALVERFQSVKAEHDELARTQDSKQQRLNEALSQMQQAKAKQRSLIEMQENYAGYFAGVKAIMQNRETVDGIVGTVADLIEIPKDYVDAVDTVLGSSSQFVVVESEKAGRDAIGYLKKNRAGRATFLPIPTIKARYIREEAKKQAEAIDGFIGIASELIQYEDRVANVIQNLLGNTIVAKDIQAANAIARAVQYRYRVVSLEGDVMNAGGSMTGGGGKRSSNAHLFSQKKELKELEIFIGETEKTVEIRQKEVEKDQTKQKELSDELESIRAEGEEKRVYEKQLQSERDSLEERRTRLEREQKAFQYESSEVEKEWSENSERLEEIKQERDTIETQVNEQKSEMSALSEQKEDVEIKKQAMEQEMSDLQEELNGAREEQAAARSQETSLNNQVEQVEEAVQALRQDMAAFEAGEDFGSKEELEEKLEQLKEKHQQLKEQERERKETQEQTEEQVATTESALSQKQGRKQYLSDEKAKVDVELSRADVTIDHLLNYLAEEYSMSYEEARLQPKLDLPVEEAQKRVKLLKKGIEELGPVNIGAIEEYERVHERWQFLTEQQEDLLEAKAKLYDTMDEMDTEVERRFKETFEQIQAQFAKVFPKMFGGGQAELRLTDPDNLLTSGVDIVAQPPGKKLSSLSLLSGGERALTAISLLFAIIQVRPIPFCILDEAEAALDEANVSRFGKYLREFETDTQFIVITHRKGTMEEADSLYGVTMQEKGVSKLVSVRLQDVDEIETVT